LQELIEAGADIGCGDELCKYAYILMCIYVYIYIYICLYIYVCVCVYVYIYISICIYVYMSSFFALQELIQAGADIGCGEDARAASLRAALAVSPPSGTALCADVDEVSASPSC